jgi:hypothetical protein
MLKARNLRDNTTAIDGLHFRSLRRTALGEQDDYLIKKGRHFERLGAVELKPAG